MNLAEFLAARFDDDAGEVDELVHAIPSSMEDPPDLTWWGEYAHLSVTPAWVRADIDAKRRILAAHAHDERVVGCDCTVHSDRVVYMDCDVCVDAGTYSDNGGWCRTVRLLALTYARHPDYQTGWAP